MQAGLSERLEGQTIDLHRGGFMRKLIRTLSDVLVDVVGLDEAAGFVSLVGQSMGEDINQLYLDALGQNGLSVDQLGAVLVDLKRRIGGDFYVIEETPERIVFGNRACPFGKTVAGQKAMCMMTSNVFGSIAAEANGYSRVELEETIAEGHAGCRVVVHLGLPEDSATATGREYFRSVGRPEGNHA